MAFLPSLYPYLFTAFPDSLELLNTSIQPLQVKLT